MTRAVSLFLFLSPPFYLKSPKPLLLVKVKESSVHADKGASSSCQSRLPTACPTLTTNVQGGFLQGFRPATKQNTREPTGGRGSRRWPPCVISFQVAGINFQEDVWRMTLTPCLKMGSSDDTASLTQTTQALLCVSSFLRSWPNHLKYVVAMVVRI